MPDRHIAAHRSADNDMIRVSNHIQYEPPNNHNRVQRLINIIQSSDIRVVSAVTTILNDNIKWNTFEMTADFLLLSTPPPQVSSELSHDISALH